VAGGAAANAGSAGEDARLSAFLDTNVLIRHLTGDPPAQARRATAFLAAADELLVPDLIERARRGRPGRGVGLAPSVGPLLHSNPKLVPFWYE
jgi:hypothetical protein